MDLRVASAVCVVQDPLDVLALGTEHRIIATASRTGGSDYATNRSS